MADVQKADGVKRGRKHTGLGRGLGALIPPVQDAPSQVPLMSSSPRGTLASAVVQRKNCSSRSSALPRRGRNGALLSERKCCDRPLQ